MIYNDFLDDDDLARYARALNQRARANHIPGDITADDLRACILDSGGACQWCAARLVDAPFEIDHIVPLQRGGDHAPANLALSCPDCNRRKSGRHPVQFALDHVARGGRRTPLIQRVLAHYHAEAHTQRSLFDPPDDPGPSDEISPANDDDIAPYRW